MSPFWFVTTLFLSGLAGGANEDRLQETIANVAANEKLYANLEAKWRAEYRLVNDPKRDGKGFRTRTRQFHCVLQDQYFYSKSVMAGETIDAQRHKHEQVAKYDGEKTRMYTGNIANIREGRFEDPFAQLRPHTVLYSYSGPHLPLSVWLRGGSDLRNHPHANADFEVKVNYVGVETVEGMSCLKFKGDSFKVGTGKHLSTRLVWLCPERNYLMVKKEGYLLQYSETLPVERGKVTAWKETAPGVWLPWQWEIEIFNEAILRRQKTPVVLGREQHVMEEARLDPKYDRSFFQEVVFPSKAFVYEVNAKGEITDDYLASKPPQKELTLTDALSPSHGWFWALLAALICVVVGLYLLFRRRDPESSPA